MMHTALTIFPTLVFFRALGLSKAVSSSSASHGILKLKSDFRRLLTILMCKWLYLIKKLYVIEKNFYHVKSDILTNKMFRGRQKNAKHFAQNYRKTPKIAAK